MKTSEMVVMILAVVANATLPEAQGFEFNTIQKLANNEVVMRLTAPAGRAYRIESAGELAEWKGLITFATNASSSLVHTDSAAPFLQSRFYRAVELAAAQVVPGDHLATTNGEAVIQHLNHATFVMQWNRKMIYVDPVSTASFTGLPKADLILVTHGHSDHFSTTTIDAVKTAGATIIAPQAVYASLTSAQKAAAMVLNNGQRTNVLGIDVDAVAAYNSNHPVGTGNGYILNIGGKRIYISGDTGSTPEMRALKQIDVAFICMNQPYTLTVTDATNVVRTIQPKVVYPYHYRNSDGTTGTAAVFKQRLGPESGIEVRLRKWY